MSSSKRNTTRMSKTTEFERQAREGRERKKQQIKRARRLSAAIQYEDKESK